MPLGEERSASVFQQVTVFAKHKISLDKPLQDLSQAQLDLLLYGDKGINADLGLDMADDTVPDAYTGSYEGIIPMLKRWFSSSQSTDVLREWVEKHMELKTCPSCNGARLKKESLWFKVDQKNIAELGAMNLDKLMAWFSDIETRLSDKQNAIARDVLKEIRERLQFLLNVGLTYLSLNRATRTLKWRRITTHQAGNTDRLTITGHHLRIGRAIHWPAPARQSPVDQCFAEPARRGQQCACCGA